MRPSIGDALRREPGHPVPSWASGGSSCSASSMACSSGVARPCSHAAVNAASPRIARAPGGALVLLRDRDGQTPADLMTERVGGSEEPCRSFVPILAPRQAGKVLERLRHGEQVACFAAQRQAFSIVRRAPLVVALLAGHVAQGAQVTQDRPLLPEDAAEREALLEHEARAIQV